MGNITNNMFMLLLVQWIWNRYSLCVGINKADRLLIFMFMILMDFSDAEWIFTLCMWGSGGCGVKYYVDYTDDSGGY